jgi:protein-tyrosine phosphatase
MNNFWNYSNNVSEENIKIINSSDIQLNDNTLENIIVFPEKKFLQPIFEQNLPKTFPLQIITNLYLGNSDVFIDFPNHFNLIINCAAELKHSYPPQYPKIIELNLQLKSNEFIEQNYLLNILEEIDQYLSKNQKVLICSVYGINRSVIIMCSYLMWKTKTSLTEALTHIQKIYPFANPEYSLINHLIFCKDFLYTKSKEI